MSRVDSIVTPGSQFASDNCAGAAPPIWDALQQASVGLVPGYGEDPYTERATDAIRQVFETDCEVFFCFTGTAANSMAIAHLCNSYHSVICHESAHIETDECGGPEFFTHGTKVLLADGQHGKINPLAAERLITKRGDIHFPKPRVLSVTQSTELGTVYRPEELRDLCDLARRHAMRVHMDGARFANAVASLGCAPSEITWRAGVDVLCFGGTKNGAMCGEAVVFFDRGLAEEFDYRCKQAGQLASKMRFLAAPWLGLLADDTWLGLAGHANTMAGRLAEALRSVDGLELLAPVEANAVFVRFPEPVIAKLHAKGWHFYTFIGSGGARLMCSWATTDADIEAVVGDVREVMTG